MSKYLPTPYIKCGASDGKCPCGQIWSKPADTPIGEIIIGKWGDKHPAIRIKEPRGIGVVVEPYMEMIEYGEIPEEVAHATIDFILLACNMHDELVAGVRKLRSQLNEWYSHELWDDDDIEALKLADQLLAKVKEQDDD